MIEIDHVIFVVDDLDRAARDLTVDHGLASIPGGRHPGHGTGNRIVPLGSTYLELMAVVDSEEATSSPLGRWAARHTRTGIHPAALCLRTDAIEELAETLGDQPFAMSRLTPDGGTLSWRLVGLEAMLDKGDPFFIQWDGPDHRHPGRTAITHAAEPRTVSTVRHGWPSGNLPELLGDIHELTLEDGVPGVHAVTLITAKGSLTLPTDR